ncbi:MAG: tetratricopeptide repeat protein [Gemmataceae bacterium]
MRASVRRAFPLAALLAALGCVTPGMEAERARARHAADGQRAFRQGGYAEAREHYTAALTLQPDDPDLLYNLGRCAEGQGKKAEAEGLYRQAIDARPDHAPARRARTGLLIATGRRAEAERDVKAWLADRPQAAAAYVEDGWLSLQAGDVDSARGRFQQALDLDPRDGRAMVELGRIYERLDHPGRAADLYRRSLALDRDQPEVRERLSALEKAGFKGARPD